MTKYSHLYCESLGWFWKRYPALLFGLSILLGFSIALQWHWSLLFPIAVIWLPLIFNTSQHEVPLRGKLLLGLLLAASAFFYTQLHYEFPHLSKGGVEGSGYFEIKNLSRLQNQYGGTYQYTGTLKWFKSNDIKIAHNIPCTIYIREAFARPPADCSYLIKGRLTEKNPHKYTLKVNPLDPWVPIKHSWSFAEWRYLAKSFLSDFIHKKISSTRSADFLTGICTGAFNNKALMFDFGRLGLQHIMAISGFHFTIIAAIFNFILRFFLTPKNAAIVLILLLTGYFALIGWSPSVQRAWTTVVIFFGGYLLEKKGASLNSLGVALIAVSITNPMNVTQIGFLFSFLSTASILLFFHGSDLLLQSFFIKRSLSELIAMNRFHQHAYVVLGFLRQVLALTIAVNLTALPMMLYFFHKFPLLSLIYNLFFPFLVTFSMLLLVLGLLIGIVAPPVSGFIHKINTIYTDNILKLTSEVPVSLDFAIRAYALPLELFIGYLCVICLGGIFLQRFIKERAHRINDLMI